MNPLEQWRDFDNDNDIDLFMSGQVPGGGSRAELWVNDGAAVGRSALPTSPAPLLAVQKRRECGMDRAGSWNASRLPRLHRSAWNSIQCALILSTLLTRPACAQAIRENIFVTNGEVHTTVSNDSCVFIGGNFDQVGPAVGAVAVLSVSDGTARRPFPLVVGSVYAITPDSTGGYFIGGSFTSVRGVPRYNLAHLDSDGNVTPWAPAVNNFVRSMLVKNGLLFVGGLFNRVEGIQRRNLAAFDLETGVLADWDARLDGGYFGDISAMAANDTLLFVGGDFGTAGDSVRQNLAALSLEDGTAIGWNPGTNGVIEAMALAESTLYVGGAFTRAGGVFRMKVAAFDAVTGQPRPWNPSPDGNVAALTVHGSTVYGGGVFGTFGGVAREGIAAWNAHTGMLTDWHVDAKRRVSTIVATDSLVYLGGYFNAVGDFPRNRIAAVSTATGSVAAWNANANGGVRTMSAGPGCIYLGGEFTSVGGYDRKNLAAFDRHTGNLLRWNPSPDFAVSSLAASNSVVHASGWFTQVGGEDRDGLAAMDARTGDLLPWHPQINDVVLRLAVINDTVYIAGPFTVVAGQSRAGLAALDGTTGAVLEWSPGLTGTTPSPYVIALQAHDRWLYVGGFFTTIGGVARNNLAAFDRASGMVSEWNPDVNRAVWCLAVAGDVVYAGGVFTMIGSSPRRFLAGIRTSDGLPTMWNPNPDDLVRSIAIDDRTIYVGGMFTSVGGKSRGSVAALDDSLGIAREWEAGTNGTVLTMTVAGNTLYMGGGFYHVASLPHSFFAGVATVDPPVPLAVSPGRLQVAPNPFRFGTSVSFTLVETADTAVDVFDVTGRLVRHLHGGWLEAGPHTFRWDGNSASGHAAGAGLYILRARLGTLKLTGKVLRVD